jgi:hypothetical protein
MKTIALIGGGPASLFMYKRIVEANLSEHEIHIFEQHNKLGAGMPYSKFGASKEHVTNVSDNEIPEIKTHVKEWISNVPSGVLHKYDMEQVKLNEYKVLPRLLFGEYLTGQFDLLLEEARKTGIHTEIHYKTRVIDIVDLDSAHKVRVEVSGGEKFNFDKVIICTGHCFPTDREDNLTGWYDSPYPPEKLAQNINYEVAIRGASLTAIDAVRTLARSNGSFSTNLDGSYTYTLNNNRNGFKIVLHSLGGLLPSMRFHLEESHPDPSSLLSDEEMKILMDDNNGFIPLDYVFDKNFRKVLSQKRPHLYNATEGKSMEQFIDFMMGNRLNKETFELFKEEYNEAEISIIEHDPIVWKETLTELSYVINYCAKHFSAEDMIRFKKTLHPLIAIIIAFVPQSSARELLALHEAGLLDLVKVNKDSSVTPSPLGGCIYTYVDPHGQLVGKHYALFIDALGQKPFFFNQLPFQGLINRDVMSPAYLRFENADNAQNEMQSGNKDVVRVTSGDYLLQLSGISINDYFQPLNQYGVASQRFYVMAVPYISGLNPDYSGLDFCEVASGKIIQKLSGGY